LEEPFSHHDQRAIIKGDPSLSKAIISSKALPKLTETKDLIKLWIVEAQAMENLKKHQGEMSVDLVSKLRMSNFNKS